MKLSSNQTAPDFKVLNAFGEEIILSKLKGKKIIVSFYRYASCPICNLRVRELILNYKELSDKNLTILSFFQSDAKTIKEYVGKQDAPFDIIPDPNMAIYKLYGVETSVSGILNFETIKNAFSAFSKGFLPGAINGPIDRMPADFLINVDGSIHTAYYGKTAGDHIGLDEIKEFIS